MAKTIATNVEPIPGYRLIERIGRGGFGEVWKAEAPGGILKAIKFVYGDLEEASSDGRPADQELKALNRIKSIRHPYILSLERYDIVDGQLIIVMELADRNLYERFRECRNAGRAGIPRDELLQYLEEAAEALDLMNNEYQIQHLDVKPQNIFLIHQHIKVADFGLAKDLQGKQATLTGGVTPVYAAPETFEGRVSRFCDQYSLAILYQELLTGQRPFDGETARRLMMQHLTTPPDVSPLPAGDQVAVKRALAKSPEGRFASCMEFVEALHSERTISNYNAIDVRPTYSSAPSASATVAVAQSRLLGVESKSFADKLPPLSARIGVKASSIENPRITPMPTRAPIPEIAGTGALMPAVIIGLGRTGLIVLQRVRQLFNQEFSPNSLSHIQLLHIDTDPATIQELNSDNAPAVLEAHEICHARLNRPSRYLRNEARFPGLDRWLSPTVLYRIPRQRTTDGIRALGRLAFCDFYRSIMARIRSKIQAATAPAALKEADAATGLGHRTNVPRIYVVANLGGGSGSGMFLDLAYAIRRQMKFLGYSQPDVEALLYLPDIHPATPTRAKIIANTYAALIELCHFSSPQTEYVAAFNEQDEGFSDRERPFERCVFLPWSDCRGLSAECSDVARGTALLFQELLTQFGRECDRIRSESTPFVGPSAHFQTYGSFRYYWPRRQVLDHAAIICSKALLQRWLGGVSAEHVARIQAWQNEIHFDRLLTIEHLRDRFRNALADPLLTDAAASINAVLTPMEQRPHASIEPAAIRSTVNELVRILGLPEHRAASEIGMKVTPIAQKVSRDVCRQVEIGLAALLDLPGLRYAALESISRLLYEQQQCLADQMDQSATKLQQDAADCLSRIEAFMGVFETKTRSGPRIAAAREVVNFLREFAVKSLELVQVRAMGEIRKPLADLLTRCTDMLPQARSRIEQVQSAFDQLPAPADASRLLGDGSAVYPDGSQTVREAAEAFIGRLLDDDWQQLDQQVQTALQSSFQSLRAFCDDKVARTEEMLEVLRGVARSFLDTRLTNVSVAELLLNHLDSTAEEFNEAFRKAAPALFPLQNGGQIYIMSGPKDTSGSELMGRLHKDVAEFRAHMINGGNDVWIYCEQTVSLNDLPQMSREVRKYLAQATVKGQLHPHARLDIDWLPLAGG